MHPGLIAAQAAMLERLAEGRFILGISPGALTTDAEALGILDEDCNKMFAEAIDVILEIWSREAPYNIDLSDNRFKVSTAPSAALELGVGYLSKLYQNPRPEIVGTVLAPSWRRSRRAWLRWVSSTSTPCRRTSCCRSGSQATGRITLKARPRSRSGRQGFPNGASRARSLLPTTTPPRSVTPIPMRIALIAPITIRY